MINDIIDALSATVTQATGLRCVELSDNPPAPCAMVYVDDITGEGYYRAMKGGVVTIPFVIEPIFPANAPRSASRQLNDTISPFGAPSIPLAILDHATLGQTTTENPADPNVSWSAVVDSVTDYGYATNGEGVRYLRAKVHVSVQITRGSN